LLLVAPSAGGGGASEAEGGGRGRPLVDGPLGARVSGVRSAPPLYRFYGRRCL